jgi:hypothetical protein
LALPQGEVFIWQKDYQYVQITMKAIVDGSRYGMDNRAK